MKKKSLSRASTPQKKRASKKREPLGHGDHWAAMGFEGDALIRLIQEVANAATVLHPLEFPWPGARMEKLVQIELPWKEMSLTVILGKPPEKDELRILSAFPVLSRTTPWVLQIDEVGSDYGLYEGVVKATADTGHPLLWFDPHFAQNATSWRAGGRMQVGLAGMALSMKPYPADPFIIHEGPRVDELRTRLRAEGRAREADDPELSVTYEMDAMRTIFSSFHDHHEFVGKVLRVAKTGLGSLVTGWRIELECRHDDHGTGRSLPVYVFPPSLEEGYVPKRGDLVCGMLWLQGSYFGAA